MGLDTIDKKYATNIPEGFVRESEFTPPVPPIDYEITGSLTTLFVEEPESPTPQQRKFATQIPEGWILETDDIWQGLPSGATELRQAPKPSIFDRAKQALRDIVEGGQEDRRNRADLVVYLAQRNRLPVNVVDKNLDVILANPKLSGLQKEIPEEMKKESAFAQAAVESLTFGIFNADELIKRQFPLQAGAGAISGGIASFMATGGVLHALGLGRAAMAAGGALQTANIPRAIAASAPRFLPPAIMTGSTFATVSGIRKAVEQVESKDINPLEIGATTMVSFAEGATLGAIGQTVGQVRRVFMASGLGYVSGKAHGYSNEEAAIQGAIWGGIEAFGGIGRDEALKHRVVFDLRNKLAQYAKKKMPSMSVEESLKRANQYLNSMAQGNLTKAIKDTPIKFMERANQIVTKMIKDWKGVKNVDVLTESSKDAARELALSIPKTGVKTVEPQVAPMASFLDQPIQPQLKPTKPLLNQSQINKKVKQKEIQEKQKAIESAPEFREQVKDMIRERASEINIGSYETNLFINNIDRVTTREQREIIPFLIEGTGIPDALGRPDLIETFKKDAKNLDPLVKQIKDHFDEGWKFMQDNMEDISANQIEDYVTHIWDLGGKNKAQITNWFVTQNKFLKKRHIETLKKGIEELGLKPKTLDISEIIRIHDSIMHKTVANQKFVRQLSTLRKDGVPLIERIDKAPMDWIYMDHPALTKAMVIPGEAVKGEKVSDELRAVLNELGLAIGRRLSPTVFGKPSKKEGHYKPGIQPEISFQRFFRTKTVAHEIGHFLDEKLKLGKEFVDNFKNEIYALNRERIERLSKLPGKMGRFSTMKEYAESTEEQIAEFFAFFFADIQTAYEKAPNATSAIMGRLRDDGVLSKLADFDFEMKAKNLIEEQLNAMVKLPVKVHPDLESPLRVVFDRRFSNRVISAYEAISGVMKKSWLSLSLFHHGALGETAIATMGVKKTLGIGFNPKKIYEALAKNEFDVYKKEPLARDAIESGLQLGATADIPVNKIQRGLNEFATKLKPFPVIKNMSQFIASFNETWDKALWSYYHDTLKLYAYEHHLGKIDPNLNVKKQKQEIAQLVNDTFGGQNWDALMVSPKTLQMMTWSLLSADWTVSTVRQGLAFTGAGNIHEESKKLRKKIGQMFWIKAFLYFGIGTNLLNAVNRKRDEEENPHLYIKKDRTFLDRTMWGNTIGHKSHIFMGRYSDGRERYLRWGKQFREVPELFIDDTGFSPLTASAKKIGGKLGPIPQTLSVVFTGHSLSGFEQRSITEVEGWEKSYEIFKYLATSGLPFSTRTIIDENKEFKLTDLAMPSSKGMSRWKAIKFFKVAIERKDERLFTEVWQASMLNNLPPETLYKSAISSMKAEATRERNSKLKTLSEVEEAMKNEEDREIYQSLNRLRRRMSKESDEIKHGSELLEKSLLRFNEDSE